MEIVAGLRRLRPRHAGTRADRVGAGAVTTDGGGIRVFIGVDGDEFPGYVKPFFRE